MKDPFYSTSAWRKLRAAVLERDYGLCTAMTHRDCQKTATQVDHITPRSQGGSWLDPDNCRSICIKCHNAKTNAGRAKNSGCW